MQKLFRRCPPAPPLLLCSSSSSSTSPLPFKPNSNNFLSFSNNKSHPTTGSHHPMHSSTSFHLPPCVRVVIPTNSHSISSSRVSVSTCRICRCSITDSTNRQQRPWLVFKEITRGSRLAWLHTAAAGGTCSTDDDDEVDDSSDGKPKLQRRVRGGSGGGAAVSAVPGNPDLLTIPGVGPRNLMKLVQKGIADVAELKQLYRDKFFGTSTQKMVEYLQSSVGIIHRNHAESITTFIKKSVDEELKEDGSSTGVKSQKKRLTFCVEGNISVGKTTFLRRIANETLELRDLVEIVPEPIDKWQDVGPDHFNILDAFYHQPERYAYTFQNYVFVTRVMQERDSSGGIQPLRLMERSVFSDRMVFVRAVHEAKWMNEMEISIYDSWFDPVVSCLPGLIPDGFIYLRASPDTCHKRMMLRKRTEEGGVSLDYLRGLHEKHESWLLPFETGNHGVLSVSKVDRSLHPEIRDRVYLLEGPQMHSSIQKVPALVLDCDHDIDFNTDIDAKRHYARQVAEFFEFVKREKELESPKADDVAGKAGHPQVLLPQQGGICLPGGAHFPQSALQNLDFRRAISFLSG